MEIRRPWRLEVLIPGLLLVAFLADAGLRFVRLDFLAFRAEEVLLQFRSSRCPGPYEPNRRLRFERSSGDLPSLANRPEYRVFREQDFTTDDLGFRNAAGSPARVPSVLMVGTSFTIGHGNSDRQTLPCRVEALSGCPTYNAGGLVVRSESILRVARDRGMRGGLIVVECLQRFVGEPILPRANAGQGRLKWLPYRAELLTMYQSALDRLEISPVQIALRRVYKSLQDDRILPNVHGERVAIRPLRDGRSMLFLLSLEKPRPPADRVAQNVEAYALIRDDLKAAGFDLALAILPDKLTVHRPLLREPPPTGGESLALLSELERSCRDRGLAVVNLAPILTDRARRAFEEGGGLLYWPDDTHWNPRGIEVAAGAICDAFGLRGRCATGTASPGVPSFQFD